MPGGLPEVSQVFKADASGYVQGIQSMLDQNRLLVASVRQVQQAVTELGRAQAALDASGLRAVMQQAAQANRELGGSVAQLGAGYESTRALIAGMSAETARARDVAVSAAAGHVRAAGEITGAYEAGRRAARAFADDIAGTAVSAEAGAARVRQAAAATADLTRETARAAAAQSSLREQARAAAEAVASSRSAVPAAGAGPDVSGAWWRSVSPQTAGWSPAQWRQVWGAPSGPSGGGGGPIPVTVVPSGGGHGGGSSGGVGDLPGGAGAFVPWRGGGFQAVKFWGMAIAEFAATAVPALIAAGSAAAVGMQGAQDVMLRAKAISTAAESIGPAYGQSVSSYIGTSGAFGRYQDAARGGVYQLAGDAIGFANAGKGTFGQLGLNTLAMIDRGTAQALVNYKARQAAGGGLGDMLSGGTQWLRGYGDLFSNLGDTVMNLAPYEPGIGGDVLNTLVGGTGAAKWISGNIPGPLLGSLMALEGGQRWSKALLGGKGLLGRVLGLGKAGGLGGLISKGGEKLFARGMGGALGDLGLGMVGAGGALAEFGGPIGDAAALSAYAMSYLASTMPTQAQRRVAGLQAGVNQAGFSAAFTPLAQAIVTTQGLASKAPGAGLAAQRQVETPYEIGRFGPGITPTYKDTYNAAAQGFSQTTADLVNAGPQLVSALKKAGLKGVSMADAFQIAQNALLDTSHAFGKNGKLNQAALQMVMSYGTAIKPMTQSAGGFNAAIAAQQIMGSPAMKSLSQVNQAMDSMTQVMTGGPAGMAALFGMLGGTPVTTKHGGLKLQASPAMAKMAQALTSFTTPGGAAAWNTFAGSQGFIAAEQQNLDQLRTYMTLGAMPLQGKTGAQGIAAFQLQQLLPMARRSPAALAMLMQQGAQMGIGGYYQGGPGNLKQNYQAEERALAGMAGSVRQIDRGMNHAVIASSNLPKTASQFSQAVGADLQSKLAAAASSDVVKLKSTLGHAGSSALISDLVSQFKTAGFRAGPALMSGLNATLKGAGFSASQIKAIDLKVKADTSQAQAQINAVHGKNVKVHVASEGPAAIQAAINSIHGKTVTITVLEQISRIASNISPTYGGGIGSLPGGPAGMRLHQQTGGRIPGYGGGDIVPAMLEPGEAVVPKHLVPAVAGFLGAHKVPGFAGGGFVGQQVSGPLAYWGAGSSMAMMNPAWYAQILAAMRASQGQGAFAIPRALHALTAGSRAAGGGGHGTAIIFGPEDTQSARKAGSQFTVHVIEGMHDGMKDTGAETKKLAQGLVSKIQQEIRYAQGVAQAAAYGQGYDPSGRGAGIFGNMNLASASGLTQAQMHASPTGNIKDYNAYVAAYAADTTGAAGQPKSVQDQMKDYLGTVKSFGTDIGKLRKGHLNKQVLAQLIAAGPEQGDALAQSILGGKGGVSAVNKLWGAIGNASKKLGSQAAMGQYGGTLAPNLKSGTFINNNISVSVSLPAGHGGGDLQLSNAQINQLVNLIQKKLLQQAKRNNKTGVKLPGKGT